MNRFRTVGKFRAAFSVVLGCLLVIPLGMMAVNVVHAQQETSGFPIPRFVSLKANEANLRAGPGTRYPVQWVYRRPDLPLKIIAEYYNWRQVRDPEGTEGWMHGSMLSGQQAVIIRPAVAVLRAKPADDAPPVARLEAGVTAKVIELEAEAGWCQVRVGEMSGWLHLADTWGAENSR